MTLIYRHLWESASGIVRDGNLGFTVVTHKDVAFDYHLEVVPFPSGFSFPSVPVPFLKADEDLGRPGEVADLKKTDILDFSCVIFQIQGDGVYPIDIDDPPDYVDFCIFPLI